jgi:hypothetical protein
MLSAVVFALIWVPRKLLGRLRGVKHLSVRLLPLLAVFCLAGGVALVSLSVSGNEIITRFGHKTVWSLTFYLLTWLFALTAVAGLIQAVRARHWEVNRGVRLHALLVSLANTIVLLYLGYWGLIGLRTWSY